MRYAGVAHAEKIDYLKNLLPALAEVRRRTGLPHRIVLDEAMAGEYVPSRNQERSMIQTSKSASPCPEGSRASHREEWDLGAVGRRGGQERETHRNRLTKPVMSSALMKSMKNAPMFAMAFAVVPSMNPENPLDM